MQNAKCKICSKRFAEKGKTCLACLKATWRSKYPELSAYHNLKTNAKRRGKEFGLTFGQFVEFCHKTDYIGGKGKTAQSLTIDRIDNEKGYTLDNIRTLTNAENAQKHTKKVVFDWEGKILFNQPFRVVTMVQSNNYDDVPF